MSRSKPDDAAQSQRFIDMAREVGASDDETVFKAKVEWIARQKPKVSDEHAPPQTKRKS